MISWASWVVHSISFLGGFGKSLEGGGKKIQMSNVSRAKVDKVVWVVGGDRDSRCVLVYEPFADEKRIGIRLKFCPSGIACGCSLLKWKCQIWKTVAVVPFHPFLGGGFPY